MIKTEYFFNELKENGIKFFCGVPDSLLKDICAYFQDSVSPDKHIITANEGSAVSMAAGNYLATGNIPLVYMQNSGIGNAVNPLLSLTDEMVYSIPMVLLIGWRGEPGVKDEPQHVKQGLVNEDLLKSLDLDYIILSKNNEGASEEIRKAVEIAKSESKPVVILVKKDTFESYKLKETTSVNSLINRELVLDSILNSLNDSDFIVSTTGKLSRELYELRDKRDEKHENDFLTVGSMGHASQIALGIAIEKKEKKVFCFDGDGALLMQMGGITSIGQLAPKNYIHIVFNNGAHDSVGGQATSAFRLDLIKIAEACNYKSAHQIKSIEELENIDQLFMQEGPIFIEILVAKGSRSDLGRPKTTPIENKNNFMNKLSQ